MSGSPDLAPRVGAPRVGPPPGVVSLLVVNLSTTIDDDAFDRAVAAVEAQVNTDFQPVWGVGASLVARRLDLGGLPADVDGGSQAILYVGDHTGDPTAGISSVFGYHDRTRSGLPYAFVYLDVCTLRDEPWTCTLSHEVLELLADPDTLSTALGPAPEGSGLEGEAPYGLEVCDPTQSDRYEIDGVLVVNFVTRAYFGEGPVGAATNFLDLDLPPFGARPGGYIQYDDGAMMQRIDGSAVDPATLRAQDLMAEHRRNARREAGLRPPDSSLRGLGAQERTG